MSAGEKMNIINVFKTHFDIGFTDLASEVIQNYGGKMLEAALDTCEATQSRGPGREFVWTMSAWPLKKALETCIPENRKRAEALIRRGQLRFHALPFTVHSEFLSPHQTEHLCDAASELCRRYGLPFPKSAKMTDVPGHTLGLIKPLAERGVKFLHLGCNAASTFPDVPTLFWWEDFEGRRLLVFYNRTYGSSLLPPPDWNFPVWLSLRQSNDNVGPQPPSVLDDLERTVAEKLPDAEFSVGTLDDFYERISECDLTDLPVVRKDLGDTWIHGVGTYPREVSALRRARFVEDLGLPDSETAQYYENALLFGEHTWGLDVKTHLTWQRSYEKSAFLSERGTPRYRKMEQSWDEQRARAEFCVRFAEKYVRKPEQDPVGCLENEFFKLSVAGNDLVIFDKKSGTSILPEYRYEIVGTQRMTEFIRSYLTRFYEWAVADFGRQSYGEVGEFECGWKLAGCIPAGDRIVLHYRPEEALSITTFGNAPEMTLTASVEGPRVRVALALAGKTATPFIEGGNFFFHTDQKDGAFRIGKPNAVLDPETDLAVNANTAMWCVDRFAQAGRIRIEPVDSPLVSFGESAVYRYNGGSFRRPERMDFVFNLFNNMWGTNFPQWTEGNFEYEYFIESV